MDTGIMDAVMVFGVLGTAALGGWWIKRHGEPDEDDVYARVQAYQRWKKALSKHAPSEPYRLSTTIPRGTKEVKPK